MKNEMDITKTKYNRKTMLFLALTLAVSCVIIFHAYIFGDRVLVFQEATDIGSDTMGQYINQYSSIVNHMRSGNWSFWDFYNGVGTNMFMLNMFNPALDILYIIGFFAGVEVIPYCIVYLFMVEIVLAGLACYVFLSLFDFEEWIKAAACIMYAFNGFLIVWGQHYQFGIICILFPLLLWAAERCIRDKKKWIAMTVITAVIVINSMYLAYMSLLAAGLYVLLRFWQRDTFQIKTYVQNVVRLAGGMLLGVGIGGFSLIPSVIAIANVSNRLESSQSILEKCLDALHPYGQDYVITTVAKFFSSTGKGINTYSAYANYYEATNLFFSALFVILVLQYVCLIHRQDASRKKKGIQYLLVVLAVLSVFIQIFGLIMNAFAYPFGRFTFVLMPYFAVISAVALQQLVKKRQWNFPVFLLSVAVIAVVYGRKVWIPQEISRKVCLVLFVSAVGMGLALFLMHYRDGRMRRICCMALLVLLVANVGADTYSSFANRFTVMKDSEDYFDELYGENITQALDYLKDNDTSFYRIEKDYGVTTAMDAMVQEYPSISSYNSTINGNFQNYVKKYWPQLMWSDKNHYRFSQGYDNVEQSSLLGVKYLLTKNADFAVDGYTLRKQFGDIFVYENESVDTIASFYEDSSGSLQEVNFGQRDTGTSIQMARPGRDSQVDASVNAASDGLLFVAIPYEIGWNVYVDGVEQEKIQVNLGFTGVHLTAGQHKVSFRYTCPGVSAGVAMSRISLLLFALCITIHIRRGKKSEKTIALHD
ncbi:MAG: YfhO family protein [Lachnospiraceae bacterium]|nr:YfhO family protein [Lachnospiraceae bacterium]